MVRNDRRPEPRRRWWRRAALVISIFLVATAAPAVARAQSHVPHAVVVLPAEADYTISAVPAQTMTAPAPVHPETWPRLRLPDPVATQMARQALDRAWRRLGQPDCRTVLNGFADPSGRPIQQRLAALSVDVQTYLALVVFIDGTRERPCMTGVLAFTTPGSRVIRICVDQLKQDWQQSPDHTAANFIHEMLHTLGLGENPPSSAEITTRVLTACFRRR
jgi:hypothetical protein